MLRHIRVNSQKHNETQAMVTVEVWRHFSGICLATCFALASTDAAAAITNFGQIIGVGSDSEVWSREFTYVNGEPTVKVSNGNFEFFYVFTVPAGADRRVDGTEMNGSGDLIWEALGECIDMITNQIIASRPTKQERMLWKASLWELRLTLIFAVIGVDGQGNPVDEANFLTGVLARRSSAHVTWATILPAQARTTPGAFGYGPTNDDPIIRTSNDAGGVRFTIGSDRLVLGGGFSCRRESAVLVVCRRG